MLMAAAFILFGWIAYLLEALPDSYRANHWKIAWVGFDFGMAVVLLVTSWALWKRRQVAIPGAMVSATFLVIDSWFDVVTSNTGWDQRLAIASAIFIEIPAAFILFRFSRLTIRKSIQNAHNVAGRESLHPSLWKTPLMIFEMDR
jgi:hypothetical protein